MKEEHVRNFVLRYLEATRCQVIEKNPQRVTVQLSPDADRDLTNRSYYWSFVERTGAAPETMKFTFTFGNPQEPAESAAKSAKSGGRAGSQTSGPSSPAAPKGANPPVADSILGRYFGVAPASQRILEEPLTYGSRRLDQIFQSCRKKGRFVHLYEEPGQPQIPGAFLSGYSSWFCVNYKVELICDMKRDELHSLGINLSTGEVAENFMENISRKQLTPRLPANTHVRETISLQTALSMLENLLEKKLSGYDYTWAKEANERMNEEISRIQTYYGDLLESAEPEIKEEIRLQYENRKQELERQYLPRIQISAINCGLFHLTRETFHEH
ncbi:YqhG family protein [Ferviditalea candida]|uniref:YqhG family protein n=1 Tax=Ferviditalea candida TaxID=3108399 RepID=A0ABU5ZCE7_9BACL|nr:YqhG family protein [Paenibacillaceae bacterium T2]